jgi:glutamine---fructose-6-phosphate transaminase (isomerizing)
MPGDQMAAEMAEQPEVLSGIARRAEREAARLAEVLPAGLCGTAFVARGSSDNVAIYGRYLAELASGRPASLVAPSLHTRYGARGDYSGYLVVALSQSGRTPEIVTTCARLRAMGAVVAALVNDLTSPLAIGSDVAIDLGAGPEHAVPATKSVTAQMALLLAATAALGPAPEVSSSLSELPHAVARVLADPEPAGRLATAWSRYGKLLVVSRGIGLAAALEVSLKCRETALVFAEGMSSADLLHGPIAALASDVPVLALDGGGAVTVDHTEIVARLGEAGVPLATASTEQDATLPLPPELPSLVRPIAAVVRGQQLALWSARVRGLDADRPAGLHKVTLTR